MTYEKISVIIKTFKTNSSLDLFFATISNQKFITGFPALNTINNKKIIFNNANDMSLNKSASKLLNTGINIKINITAIS